MTGYPTPWEQKWASDQAELLRKVESLEHQINQLVTGAVAVTSTTHPSNPTTGMRIYEVDTDLEAYWNGTAWVYPPQLLASLVLTGTAASMPLTVPGGVFSNLRVVWTGRSTNAGTADYMCLQLNNDTTNTHYTWQFNQSNVTTDSSAGSAGTTDRIRIGTLNAAGGTSGYLGSGAFEIPNANGGSNFKAPSGYSNSANSSTNAYSGTYGGMWLQNSAVTSITLFANSGSLSAGSAFLYGE